MNTLAKNKQGFIGQIPEQLEVQFEVADEVMKKYIEATSERVVYNFKSLKLV